MLYEDYYICMVLDGVLMGVCGGVSGWGFGGGCKKKVCKFLDYVVCLRSESPEHNSI